MSPRSDMSGTLEHRLERGEIVPFAPCPFPLPKGEDLTFLLRQRVSNSIHKNISYNPTTQSISGFAQQESGQPERLRQLLADFSRHACDWLAQQLPGYACAWQVDRASLRTEESTAAESLISDLDETNRVLAEKAQHLQSTEQKLMVVAGEIILPEEAPAGESDDSSN